MSKVQKSRLGRGLSSLLSLSDTPIELELPTPQQSENASGNPSADHPQQTSPAHHRHDPASPAEIPVSEIKPNPSQPRTDFDDARVAELAASIKSTGVIQPVILRRVDDGYELIAGERRLRAAKLAGLATVPAVVREASSVEQAQMALIENIQREDLNPIDRARCYRALMDQLGLTQAELAQRTGEERSSVANFLRLLDLSDSVREMVRQGSISAGHGKLLASVRDAIEQERLAGLVLAQELSVRNLERLMANPASAPAQSGNGGQVPASAHQQDLERSITSQIGLRVQLKAGAKKGRGRLVIHYANLDEFDTLLSRLGVTVE